MNFVWDDLQFLEALDRTEKVGSAARALGVSVSTFYRRVAELEQRSGQLCIKRGPTGASLTDFGRALAQVGRRTRTGLNDVFADLRAKETQLEGEVSLTTVVALEPILRDALVAFTREHPGLHVNLLLGDDGPSVRLREVDLAVGVMKRPPVGCWGRRLLTMQPGIFGTKEAIAQKRWVVRAMAEVSSPESAWEREHATSPAVRAPFHALVDLAASGAGMGLMPAILAKRHSQLVEVESYRPSLAALHRPVWLLVHPDQRRTPRIVALMRAVTSAFVGLPES